MSAAAASPTLTTFGVPYDRGAHWLYLPDTNPLTKLAPNRGDIYPAPRSQKVRIGRRFAREGELEDFLSAQVRATRAIDELARKADAPCEQAMPADLGDWKPTVEFVLGPYNCARDLTQVSAFDFGKAAERKTAAFAKQGLGTLLASLAQGLTVQLSTPATAIDTRGGISVVTAKGTINARTAIVTVPTNVISSGGLKFTPDLEHHQFDAFGRMSLGSYDHIALELTGNPLGLDSDDLVFEKSGDNRTAALLANISGTPLCVIDVAGSFGRDLSAKGEAEMFAFATDWLVSLYGAEIKNAIGRKARHPLEQRSLYARRLVGRGARQPIRAPAIDGSGRPITSGMPARPRMRPCGARSAAPGNPASAPRMRCCARSAWRGRRAQATSETDTAAQDKHKGQSGRRPHYGETTRRSYRSAPSYTGTPNIMGNER